MARRTRINTKLKSERLFTTGSSASGDTILTASYDQASASFAANKYLDSQYLTWTEGALVYQMQKIKDDIDDLHAEVSSSIYEGSINSGSQVSEIKNLTDQDTTPSVDGGSVYQTVNTRATAITKFDDGAPGQQITIIINDAYTDFTHGGARANGDLTLNRARDWTTCAAGDTISFISNGRYWYELHRSDNT